WRASWATAAPVVPARSRTAANARAQPSTALLRDEFGVLAQNFAPPRALGANEGVELGGLARDRDDAGVLQALRHRRIGVDGGDEALPFPDDLLRRAGRRIERDPGRDIAELGHAGGGREQRQVG